MKGCWWNLADWFFRSRFAGLAAAVGGAGLEARQRFLRGGPPALPALARLHEGVAAAVFGHALPVAAAVADVRAPRPPFDDHCFGGMLEPAHEIADQRHEAERKQRGPTKTEQWLHFGLE